MNRIILIISNVIAAVLLLSSCGGSKTASISNCEADTIVMRHSANLTMVDAGSHIVATIRNPWDTTKVLHSYVLVPYDSELPANLPEGTVVRTPIKRAVVYSSVHCSLIDELGATQSIAGVCDMKYISTPAVQAACRSGKIADVGEGLNPDIEKIIDIDADAIFLSPFENSGGYGRVEKIGIPIIECADYMETSALGRAEWMRFYGALFGEQEKAEEMFDEIEKSYNELKALAATATTHPSLVVDTKTGSTWYVAGGKSTLGRLYSDAGANYLFADYDNSGSVPLAFETVFDRAQNADIWIIRYNQAKDKTYSELKQDYEPYARMKAFKERNIYGCNTNHVNFYEETPFHPDLLLKDIMALCHPELFNDYKLKFFTKFAE